MTPNPQMLRAYHIPSGNNGAWQKRISAENIIARWFGVTKEARKSYFRRNEGAFSRGSSV